MEMHNSGFDLSAVVKVMRRDRTRAEFNRDKRLLRRARSGDLTAIARLNGYMLDRQAA